ncbi:MAG: NADH-quinone oxidoreductase subunit NuoF [Verrucomicrobiae bacterium]|nr:NADH-quinone oxidoreductase subunit NuoF [Verrucomicrobiae bacterium]
MDLAELEAIAGREQTSRKRWTLRCCAAAGCLSLDADATRVALTEAVRTAGLEDQVEVRPVGCLRLCCQGPLVRADPDNTLFEKVEPDQAAAVLAVVTDGPGKDPGVRIGDPGHPFFTRQVSVVLSDSGQVDPGRIESAIAAGAYLGLHTALLERTPSEVVETIQRSGLRGRGGAGYPTGLKWSTVARSPGPRKFVICNADEGDPGAFMDRSVLESDPHRILEGMAIAAYAVGADQGYIYVRAEYPIAIRRLQEAIRQARQRGLVGSGIFESPFHFNVELRIGAGAFVCGEETALMASVEGRRGTPRPRPPFPAESGLWECPTLINNVETFANVPPILRHGADWFAGIGTDRSKGTKVFALAGRITNTGLIEVPMGTSLREIVQSMGGGAPGGATIKAVQTGGPSGGCIPAGLLDTPVDYESLAALGSIMGSGGMIVMDASTDMVDVARYFMDFCRDESCGKCIPCRAGTVQMHRLLTRILESRATAGDLTQLEALCDLVRHTSLCGLGQTAPNPVLSTLRHFRREYEERLRPDPDTANPRHPAPGAP